MKAFIEQNYTFTLPKNSIQRIFLCDLTETTDYKIFIKKIPSQHSQDGISV